MTVAQIPRVWHSFQGNLLGSECADLLLLAGDICCKAQLVMLSIDRPRHHSLPLPSFRPGQNPEPIFTARYALHVPRCSKCPQATGQNAAFSWMVFRCWGMLGELRTQCEDESFAACAWFRSGGLRWSWCPTRSAETLASRNCPVLKFCIMLSSLVFWIFVLLFRFEQHPGSSELVLDISRESLRFRLVQI